MRIALLLFSCFLLFAGFSAAVDESQPMPTPLMRTVDPYMAKVGTEVLISGDNLSSKFVAEVYLQAQDINTKVEILNQEDKQIRIKVPEVKPGNYRVIVLLNSAEPLLIEEPVRLMIEE